MAAAPGVAKKLMASAISSVVKARAWGLRALKRSKTDSGVTSARSAMLATADCMSGLSTKPGQMALTVTPWSPTSMAKARVKPNKPALEAQ